MFFGKYQGGGGNENGKFLILKTKLDFSNFIEFLSPTISLSII